MSHAHDATMLIQPLAATFSVLGMPLLWGTFLGGAAIRWVMYVQIHAQLRFLNDLERRVHRWLSDPARNAPSFPLLLKRMLETTYQEHYHGKKHTQASPVDKWAERFLSVPQASATLVTDTLHHTSHWRGDRQVTPRFAETSRYLLANNPGLSRVLGLFRVGTTHRILNALPALLILFGTVSTLLSVMLAMNDLSHVNLASLATADKSIRFSLSHSTIFLGYAAVGCLLAAVMMLLNAVFDAERTFLRASAKLGATLQVLFEDAAPAGSVTRAEETTAPVKAEQPVPPVPSPRLETPAPLARFEPPIPPVPSRQLETPTPPPRFETSMPSPQLETAMPPPRFEPPTPSPRLETPMPPPRFEPIEKSVPFADPVEPSGPSFSYREPSGPSFLHSEPVASGNPAAAPASRLPASSVMPREVDDTPLPEGDDEMVIPAEQVVRPELPETPRAQPVSLAAAAVSPDPFAQNALPPNWGEIVAAGGEAFGHPGDSTAMPQDSSLPEPSATTPSLTAPEEAVLWGGAPPDPTSDRIAILQHRLAVVEEYLTKAAEDRMHGVISEEMWREESDRWSQEKETLAREIQALEPKRRKAA